MASPKLTDVFTDPQRRKAVDDLKPDRVEDDSLVKQLSKAYGAIERGINEARYIIEQVPEVHHEMIYEAFDQLADHAYEQFRHIVYDEPMVRWVRSK